jgi:hypothetical protein
MMTVAHMASSVHDFVDRARLCPAVGAVARTLIGGIMSTGSVVLSEIVRPQVAKDALHAAEQRVSQALKTRSELDQLPEVYLAMVAPVACSLEFRSVDGSDVCKPASRKLEALDVVRDGSAPPRDRVVVGPGGVQPSTPPSPTSTRNARKRTRRTTRTKVDPPTRRAPRPRTVARAAARQAPKAPRIKIPSPPALKKLGYWMIQIEAGDGGGNHLPLFQTLFSTQDPAYQALGENAWALTYQQAIEGVLAHVGGDGKWLFDRGFDGVEWMNWLHAKVEQSILRLKANRLVHPGTMDQKALPVGRLAEALEARHMTQIRYIDKSTHEEKCRLIRFAYAPIWIDGVDHPLYLIVGHTGYKHPLLLVTDRCPRSAEEAGLLIQAYLERWGNEEVTRACKQLTGLERIRVRSLAAMRRLVWCGMIAVGLQALCILTRPRVRRAILNRAKEFIAQVRFVAYRVWRVIKEDMMHALKIRPHLFT